MNIYFRSEFIEFFALNTIDSSASSTVPESTTSSSNDRNQPAAKIDDDESEAPSTPVIETNSCSYFSSSSHGSLELI